MLVLSLACHLPHNTPNIPSRYNNEQTTKQTKAINNSYIYIDISCKCDTNRAGHFTLDAYASRPVACSGLHQSSAVLTLCEAHAWIPLTKARCRKHFPVTTSTWALTSFAAGAPASSRTPTVPGDRYPIRTGLIARSFFPFGLCAMEVGNLIAVGVSGCGSAAVLDTPGTSDEGRRGIWRRSLIETEMSFWRNFNHWLHWKLSFWQHLMLPVVKISSKW